MSLNIVIIHFHYLHGLDLRPSLPTTMPRPAGDVSVRRVPRLVYVALGSLGVVQIVDVVALFVMKQARCAVEVASCDPPPCQSRQVRSLVRRALGLVRADAGVAPIAARTAAPGSRSR